MDRSQPLRILRLALGSSDLRRKLLITLLILIVYRFLTHIPMPGFTPEELALLMQSPLLNSDVYRLANLFSGGAAVTFSAVALGIFPYFTAVGILNSLIPVFPRLEELSKERYGYGQLRRASVYLMLPLAIIQALGAEFILLPKMGLTDRLWLSSVTAVCALTAGSYITLYLAELITERGIGNGRRAILFANLAAMLPPVLMIDSGGDYVLLAILIGLLILLTILNVVLNNGQRRVAVQYGKRVHGTRLYSGPPSTYMPLMVAGSHSDAKEIVFSLVALGGLILTAFPEGSFMRSLETTFSEMTYLVPVLLFLGGVLAAYLLAWMENNTEDLAESLQRHGGFVPNVRPGRSTAEYLRRIVQRIALVGVLYAGLYTALPWALQAIFHTQYPVYSVLAVGVSVGYVVDTWRQVNAEVAMRNYEGFVH